MIVKKILNNNLILVSDENGSFRKKKQEISLSI